VRRWRSRRRNSLRPSFDVIQGKEFLVKLAGFHSTKKPRSLLKVEVTKLRGTRPGR
jgi:hypothetical protein